MLMHRYFIVLTCVFFIASGIARAEDKPRKGMPPAPVEIVEAVERLMAPVTWVAASVVSRADVRVSAENEGRLEFIIDVGEHVQQGQVVARIDASRLALQMKQQQARVRRAQAQRNFLQQEVKRLGRLAGQNNAARTQLERIEAEYEVAKADLALTMAQRQQFQDDIDRSKVQAPFAGVVIQRYMQTGEWATKGKVLLQMLDPIALEIQLDAPLSSASYLHPGDELLVRGGGIEKTARIRTLTNAAASSSRQLALRLDIDNASWLVGQSLRVAVPVDSRDSMIAVPRDALVMRRSGIAVFRVNGEEKAERVAVTTGIAEGDWIAISGDIVAGDRVITRGAERLRPSQAVKIINAGESP